MIYTKWNDPKNYEKMTEKLEDISTMEPQMFVVEEGEYIEHSYVKYCIWMKF